jgi:arylsulfatase A-like enzyme
VPEELYPSRFIGDRAIAYLENHARQRPGAPFFLMCSFPDPHHPFTPPGRYWDMFDPAALKLPRSFAHPRALMPAPLAWLHDERQAGKAPLGSHRAFAVEEAEARQAIALTYGMIALVDDMVASILKALATLGFADNTVVVFTSDHGDFMGDHGLLLKGPLHYRSLIRVPLVWRDPEIGRPGRSRALASTIDIPETILDRAGLAGPQGAQGISLMSIMRGERETVRDALLIEDETQRAFLGFSRPIRVRTMVTSDSRLSLYGEGEAGEMYETGQDPDEMTNLWDAPSHRSVRAQRVERLARLMLDMGDRSPLPTGLA